MQALQPATSTTGNNAWAGVLRAVTAVGALFLLSSAIGFDGPGPTLALALVGSWVVLWSVGCPGRRAISSVPPVVLATGVLCTVVVGMIDGVLNRQTFGPSVLVLAAGAVGLALRLGADERGRLFVSALSALTAVVPAAVVAFYAGASLPPIMTCTTVLGFLVLKASVHPRSPSPAQWAALVAVGGLGLALDFAVVFPARAAAGDVVFIFIAGALIGYVLVLLAVVWAVRPDRHLVGKGQGLAITE